MYYLDLLPLKLWGVKITLNILRNIFTCFLMHSVLEFDSYFYYYVGITVVKFGNRVGW
jgi:hypothetical protein